MTTTKLNKYSARITQVKAQGASQAMATSTEQGRVLSPISP